MCEVTPDSVQSRIDKKGGYVAGLIEKIQRGEVIPDCDVTDEKKTPVEARGQGVSVKVNVPELPVKLVKTKVSNLPVKLVKTKISNLPAELVKNGADECVRDMVKSYEKKTNSKADCTREKTTKVNKKKEGTIAKKNTPKKIMKKKNLSVISKVTPKKETVITSEIRKNLLSVEDDIPEDDRPERAFKVIGNLKFVDNTLRKRIILANKGKAKVDQREN